MTIPRHNKRQRSGKGKHYGPPIKKRRFNDRSRCKLSPEESKVKCLRIVKTLQEALERESMDLMQREKVTETDVGITVFLNDDASNDSKAFRPISANLKKKFEDFIVSEIDVDGNAVKLTSDASITDAHSINKNASLIEAIAMGTLSGGRLCTNPPLAPQSNGSWHR